MAAPDSSPFTRIVVPFDGSALSARVFPTAADLADYHGATIHVITVMDPSRCVPPALLAGANSGRYLSADEAGCLARLRGEAIWALHQAAAAFRTVGLPVKAELRLGAVVPNILAALRPGDVIVLPGHHQDPYRRRYDSITEALLRETDHPIVVVPVSDEEHETFVTPLAVRSRREPAAQEESR